MKDPKGPVKPYRSPQEIAKKHNVSLEKIMQQVKMGTKVEGEHTTSKAGARITALQHVDELPDYYTKLKKVEKKPSMKESLETAKMGLEGKRYCKLCRKEETQQECRFGPDMWNRFSIATVHPTNEEVLGEKKGLWDNIHARRKKGLPPKKPGEKGYPKTLDIDEDHKEIASVDESVIGNRARNAVADDRLSAEQERTDASMDRLRAQTKRHNKSTALARTQARIAAKKSEDTARAMHPKPGVSGYRIEDTNLDEDHKEIASGKKKDEEGYMANVEFDQIERAVSILRKRITKGNQQIPAWVQSKITRAADFIDTAADYMQSEEDVSEGMDMKAFKAQRSKVKRSEKRAADKIAPNRRAGIHADKASPERAARHRANVDPDFEGNDERNYPGGKLRAKKVRKAKALGELGEQISEDLKQARKNVGASKCWPGKVAKGTKMKGGREVPNCVPAEDTCKTFSQFMQLAEASPAWQRKEGKNPEGGLNRKGIASYRRENPGSKLSMAVTTPPSKLDPDSKAAKRRKSFCARMGGSKGPMKDEKGRPTRKALSLRKWNC